MTPERYLRINQLFEAAAAVSPQERAAFLDEACAGDAALRREVESLIAAQEDMGDFLTGGRRHVSAQLLAGDPGESTRETAGLKPSAGPAFSAGQLLAGRFKIVRFIARGGMGEVYEAQDLALGESVALKTVRQAIVQNHNAMARFTQEIRLARKVTHPNVCRVFDLFHDRADPTNDRTPGLPAEVTFLTMELLQGLTLRERLLEAQQMTAAEALPIIVQVGQGLAAAHRAGIIHRDMKSANVILVPDPNTGGTRAVVTDFGIARITATDDSGMTGAGDMIGTPDYMAPEQVEGGKVTEATDIYSFGVVMYEMVTGRRPFEGDTPLVVAVKRLKSPAPSPRTFAPEIDPQWERVILRCLERDPSKRFANVLEVLRALGVEDAGRSPRQSGRRGLVLAGLALLAVLVVAIAFQFRIGRKTEPVPAAEVTPAGTGLVKPRRSVAVLGFRNLSGRSEAAWLSTALAEMLATELASGDSLRTVPGESIARMKIELGLADADSFARDTLGRIHRNLAVDLVVAGSYATLGPESGGQIRLDLRLQDAVGGNTLASVAETGTEGQLFALVTQAGGRLRQRLELAQLSATEIGAVRASVPANPEAARLYAEGLTKLRYFNAVEAKDLLTRAVAADPSFPLSHAALASAWSALGYDREAKQAAEKAFALSAHLSREDRLSVEGRYREILRESSKAIEVYGALWRFFPDNLEYGLRLATAQTDGSKATDAFATLESLRKLPPALARDPRIDLEEAIAASTISDFKRQEAASARAGEKSKTQEARLLLARARIVGGDAHFYLGETAQAKAFYEEAGRIFESAGDRRGQARAMSKIGDTVIQRGDPASAKRMYDSAIRIYTEIGNKSGVANSLYSLGDVYGDLGDLAGALRSYGQAVTIYRELGDGRGLARALSSSAFVMKRRGDLPGAERAFLEALALSRERGAKGAVAAVLGNLGTVYTDKGEIDKAKGAFEEALTLSRETKFKAAIGGVLNNFAYLLMSQGDLDRAEPMFQDARIIFREIGHKSHEASSIDSLAGIRWRHGEVAAAKKDYEEALKLHREVGDRRVEAGTVDALAIVHKELGNLQEARRLHEQALAVLRAVGEKRSLAHALNNLADLEIQEGNLGAARKAASEAVAVIRQVGEKTFIAHALSTQARVLQLAGDLKRARAQNEEALALRIKLGEEGTAAESRVALALVALDADLYDEAERLARQGLEVLRAKKERTPEVYAGLALTRVLLAQGRHSDAAQAIGNALAISARNENRLLRAETTIADARVRAAAGKVSEARSLLERVREETKKLGLVALDLDAQLALGEIDLESQNAAAGRARLEALEKEARKRGFALMAQKAARLRQSKK